MNTATITPEKRTSIISIDQYVYMENCMNRLPEYYSNFDLLTEARLRALIYETGLAITQFKTLMGEATDNRLRIRLN